MGGASACLVPALSSRPKLTVLIVLEEFRQDDLDALSPSFRPAGLRRLLSLGAHFPDCRHLASTFPASSIATLSTGAWPSQHGIVADSWYDRASHKLVPASGEALLASTLCSQVVAAGATRTFAISMDAAHSALAAGSPATTQFSLNPAGLFTTVGEQPTWLAEFNRTHSIDDLHGEAWKAIDAKLGAPPLRILTFHPARPHEFVNLFVASPFGQQAQFELLGQLIDEEELGQGDTTDFVCLIVGSTARLGYETGGNDPLMRQLILHLDRNLETLLVRLGKAVGDHGFNLILAGAHGAPPAPTAESRPRMSVNGETVAQTVDRTLAAAGHGHVARYIYPFLYLEPTVGHKLETVRLAAARAALDHPAVAGYYTAGGHCSTHDGWEARFRNSFHPVRSGDAMLSYRPELVEDFGQGRGISYGSLYNYDVRVPLCFYGPQFRAGVFESPVKSIDVAPTLARALGVASPSSAAGRVLGEAFI
jgi:hypothetical protein